MVPEAHTIPDTSVWYGTVGWIYDAGMHRKDTELEEKFITGVQGAMYGAIQCTTGKGGKGKV